MTYRAQSTNSWFLSHSLNQSYSIMSPRWGFFSSRFDIVSTKRDRSDARLRGSSWSAEWKRVHTFNFPFLIRTWGTTWKNLRRFNLLQRCLSFNNQRRTLNQALADEFSVICWIMIHRSWAYNFTTMNLTTFNLTSYNLTTFKLLTIEQLFFVIGGRRRMGTITAHWRSYMIWRNGRFSFSLLSHSVTV